MTAALNPASGLMTYEEFCIFEAASETKHDFDSGKIIDMAGGSLAHSQICVNILAELRAALKGNPCQILDSNFRIAFPRKTYTHYTDGTIVCDKPAIDPRDKSGQSLVNPTAIFEVLSPSTEAHDRGTKFDRYRTLESFREYALVLQDRAEIQTFLRQDDGSWKFNAVAGRDASVTIHSIGVTLSLSEVYDRVTFPPPDESALGQPVDVKS